MRWFEVSNSETADAADPTQTVLGIMEFEGGESPTGVPLEFYVRFAGARTMGFWMLEDGTILGSVRAGQA